MGAKTTQLQIRVSPAEKAAIRRAARRRGMDVSAFVLSRVLSEPERRFQQRIAACGVAGSERLALAELGSLLAGMVGEELRAAVTSPPQVELEPWVAAYIASMVELVCARKGEPAPEWTVDVPPLERPLFGSALLSVRLHLLASSPAAFRRRNIFVDATVGDGV